MAQLWQAGSMSEMLPLPPAGVAHHLRLAAYQPDIAQNTGAMLRLCACLGVGFDIIRPCGFVLDDTKLRRVAMDYTALICHTTHTDWPNFYQQLHGRRLLLLTTRAAKPYTTVRYRPDDVLLVGRESAGVPDEVHQVANERLLVPMAGSARSLNIVTAAAMVLGEALRQVNDNSK